MLVSNFKDVEAGALLERAAEALHKAGHTPFWSTNTVLDSSDMLSRPQVVPGWALADIDGQLRVYYLDNSTNYQARRRNLEEYVEPLQQAGFELRLLMFFSPPSSPFLVLGVEQAA